MKRLVLTAAAAVALAACGKGSDEAQPAPPRADSLIDVQQEAQRVQLGMTEGEVVRILGDPRNRVKDAGGERLTFWAYDAQKQVKARVYVTFDGGGKVSGVETIPL